MPEERDKDGFLRLIPKKYTVGKKLNKIKNKEIRFRHGHIAICDYKLGDNYEFEKSLSRWDKMRFKYELIGGYYVKELKEFRINRGYDMRLLQQFFPNYKMSAENDAYPYDDIKIELYAEPRDDLQRVALTFMASQGQYVRNAKFTQQMITSNTGSGKSQPDDTLIPTPIGIRRFDSLKPGDVIYDINGNAQSILGVYPQGVMDCYKITLIDGRTTRCGYDHLWNVKNNDGVYLLPFSYILNDYKNNNGFTDYKLPVHDKFNINPYEFDYSSISKKVNMNNKKLEFLSDIEQDDIHYIGIQTIEQIEPVSQRCILVENPNHLYITEDFIITHNTYCGAGAVAYYGVKSIIFVPFAKLINQWKESFINFTSIKEDEIMVIQGSKSCKKILDGKAKDKKVFIIMVDTFFAFHEANGDLETIELLRATRANIKIVDEVHKDMKCLSMIEALSNFRLNYYMSASPGRSDKKENWIFKSLFKNVPSFGANFTMQDEKHINIMIKKYEFIPNSKQINRMINRKLGLNTKLYENELVYASDEQKASFINAVKVMLTWSKSKLKEENKILILAQSISMINYIKEIAEEFFPGQCSLYYGELKKKEKEKALESKVIIGISSSLGTGADISHLQHVYMIGTYSNWIDSMQLPGRARKLKDGTEVVYVEFVNFGWAKTVRQFENRKRYLVDKSKSGKLIIIN